MADVESDDFQMPDVDGMEGFTFNEEDLNDPAILAELAALQAEDSDVGGQQRSLRGSISAPHVVRAPTKHTSSVDHAQDHVARSIFQNGPITMEAFDEDQEISPEELDDAALQEELRKLGLAPPADWHPATTTTTTKTAAPDAATHTTSTAAKASTNETETEKERKKERSRSPLKALVRRKSKDNLKTSGSEDGLNTTTNDAEAEEGDTAAAPTAVAALSKQDSSLQRSASPSLTSLNRSPPKDGPTPSLHAMTQHLLALKQAAVAHKRAGDLTKAKAYLQDIKKCDDIIHAIKRGESPVYHIFDPEMPAAPAQAPGTLKRPPPQNKTKSAVLVGMSTERIDFADVARQTVAAPSTSTSSSPNAMLTHLTDQLNQQIATLHTLSAAAYAAGKKEDALTYHKLRKRFMSDLDLIPSLPKDRAPKVSLREVEYELIRVEKDISAEEAEVRLERVSVIPQALRKNSDFAVTWTWPWPDDKGAKGTTSYRGVSDDGVAEFAHADRTSIARNKAFHRFVERKKIVFELWQNKGLFRGGKIPIGKVTLGLTDLLTKCEVSQVIEFNDINNPRKTIGPLLEFRVTLRQPLDATDVVRQRERWIVLEEFSPYVGPLEGVEVTSSVFSPIAGTNAIPQATHTTSAASPAAATAAATKGTAQIAQPAGGSAPVSRNTSFKSNRSTAVVSSTAQSSPVQPRPPSAISVTSDQSVSEHLHLMMMQFDNPDTWASNVILEYELGRIDEKLTAKNLKEPQKDELQDRKMQIEIKMQVMTAMVQSGKLTINDYIAQVKTAIQETKKLALAFKQENQREYALLAMARIKRMQEEVDEVEQAQAEGVEI